VNKIAHLKLPKLQDLAVRVDASAFYPSIADWYTNQGTAFVRVGNILNFQLIEKDLLFLLQNIVNKFKSIRKGVPGDIVISKGGTVGNVAMLQEKYPIYALSRDIILLKTSKLPRDKSVTILLFLGSKFGIFQLIRGASQQIQPHLALSLIRNLLVPDKTVNEATRLYDEALNKISISKSFYLQAEKFLLEELGLKDFEPEDELSYVVNLYDVKSAHRADAAYFQPKYTKIEEKLIKDFNAKKIKYFDFVKVTTGQYSEQYATQTDGKPYIRGTDLSKGTIEIDNLVYIAPNKQNPLKKAREGDVVVTRVGTIGISARLPKEVEGGTISDNLIRLRFKEEILNSYYVSLFLNTIGSQLMIRASRGSVQARLTQETLREIILPIPPKPTQEKIADLVIQSYKARKMAKNLLEKAKREVERFVDKNRIKEK